MNFNLRKKMIKKFLQNELIQNIVDKVNDYSGEQDGNDSTRRNTKEFVFITKFKIYFWFRKKRFKFNVKKKILF